MDEETKAQVSSIPTPLSMEGEVQQGEGGYRQHSWTSGRGDKMEVYVVGGYSYRFTEATGWLYTDPSEFSLNLSDLYDFSPQDFEDMLGFVEEVQVVEDSPEKLVVYFDAGSEYLLSALEKSRARYEAEGRLVIYDMLYGLLSNSSTGITSHIYKDNGYLERQEVTMRLPDTPYAGHGGDELRQRVLRLRRGHRHPTPGGSGIGQAGPGHLISRFKPDTHRFPGGAKRI